MPAHSTPASAEERLPEQSELWLRGLLSIAWADGEYDPQEQQLVQDVISSDWPEEKGKNLDPITPEELAAQLQPELREDFLRTAVMTAVADGVYSEAEDRLLQQFAAALGLELPQLDLLRATLVDKASPAPSPTAAAAPSSLSLAQPETDHGNFLDPLRNWLDGIQVHNPRVARFLCRLIPAQCPFERDVVVFGHKILHIPPMCKLNPLYEQVVGLRLRALSFLAETGEDISQYT